jgi:polyferredoxin
MNRRQTRLNTRRLDRLGRALVQGGFLLLFLYPFLPLLLKRYSLEEMPVFTSWLLPLDPLLNTGLLVQRGWGYIVIGAPLLLLALAWLLGRSFCGWMCPVGTTLDLVGGPLRKLVKIKGTNPRGNTEDLKEGGKNRNSRLRYYLLLAGAAGGVLSLQVLGWFDPLVVFQRAVTAMVSNFFVLESPALNVYLSVLSLVFVGMLVLEIWQPRAWCRHLCPLGALLSLVSRFSLLKRFVNESCTSCGQCSRACPMDAIHPGGSGTDYSDCTFCLACAGACPQDGIAFGFVSSPVLSLDDMAMRNPKNPTHTGPTISRREFTGGLAAAAAGLALTPLAGALPRHKLIRPPGALPEDEFVRTCIVCQECIRVCPTGGLRPAFLQGGLQAIGTPMLVPRLGGCALNPSCPNLCARACPVGAIKPIPPADLRLGLAQVDHNLCLAWDQGVRCLVCVEACLVGSAQAFHGRIVVDPNKCTGCGRCETGCPVAGSAIRVHPLG